MKLIHYCACQSFAFICEILTAFVNIPKMMDHWLYIHEISIYLQLKFLSSNTFRYIDNLFTLNNSGLKL